MVNVYILLLPVWLLLLLLLLWLWSNLWLWNTVWESWRSGQYWQKSWPWASDILVLEYKMGWSRYGDDCLFQYFKQAMWIEAYQHCHELNTGLPAGPLNLSFNTPESYWCNNDGLWIQADYTVFPTSEKIFGNGSCMYVLTRDYVSGSCDTEIRDIICMGPCGSYLYFFLT